MKNLFLLFLLMLSVLSCDYFEYHPYDIPHQGSGYRDINHKNIDRINSLDQSDDTIRFAFMGDTQRFYDETVAFVNMSIAGLMWIL